MVKLRDKRGVYMKDLNREAGCRHYIMGALMLMVLVVIDMMTNELDINKYNWDFKYYIAFAEEGFGMKDLISPVAYRYMTPFFAALLHAVLPVSIPEAFKVSAYMGLWLQLMGVYLFVCYYTKSFRGAVIAALVTAFSAVNVKFLLFDPYRPDIFAYAIVLAIVYLIFEKRVLLAMMASAIGVQFREFAIVPLIAYFASLVVSQEWHTFRRYIIPLMITLVVAVLLPRVIIPVTQSYQYVKGIADLWRIPMDWWRDFNWLYTIIIYFLPTYVLLTKERFRKIKESIAPEHMRFLVLYTLLVALLSLYGGTDLSRFATFMFLPQIIFVGHLSMYAYRAELIYLIVSVFLFNKIHTDIPVWDFNLALDWYGGYANLVTKGTYIHLLWVVLIVAGAIAVRKVLQKLALK